MNPVTGLAAGTAMITASLTGPADHSSIGAALAAAPDGATILVDPDDYAESLVFHRPATIVAASSSGAVTVAAPAGPAVSVAAGSATLRLMAAPTENDLRTLAPDDARSLAGGQY